jgi:hypothetical protein
MKNVKTISRQNLKTIKGGLIQCGEDLPPCGTGWCCAKNSCRPLSHPYCQM